MMKSFNAVVPMDTTLPSVTGAVEPVPRSVTRSNMIPRVRELASNSRPGVVENVVKAWSSGQLSSVPVPSVSAMAL